MVDRLKKFKPVDGIPQLFQDWLHVLTAICAKTA